VVSKLSTFDTVLDAATLTLAAVVTFAALNHTVPYISTHAQMPHARAHDSDIGHHGVAL